MRHWLILLLFASIVFPGFTKSKSYATNRGYSHSGSFGNYIPGKTPTRLQRYLYSAYQHGYVEGNLQTNFKYAGFFWEPYLNVSSLVMTDPGHSTVDLYFQQNHKYFLESAQLSILEKLTGYEVGKLSIEVNGQNLISHHSAKYNHRFDESSWNITRFCKDGLNHISIKLDSNGGRLSLLGVKIETQERLEYGDGSNTSDSRFIRKVFRRYHNRMPTPRELTYYMGLLERGVKTRAEVKEMIRALSDDPIDSYEQIVTDYFQRYAHRYPTPDEREYYANKLRRNELTLPQLREICQSLDGTGGDTSIENRIKNLFMEIVQRYPTDSELSYYSRKIRSGELSWAELRQELTLLIEDGMGGMGLSRNEIYSFRFTRYELTHSFWNKLERTSDYLLREMLQRANHTQMYGSTNEVKTVAGRIYRRIRTIQMRRPVIR